MKKYKVSLVSLEYWYEFINFNYNKTFIVTYNKLENINDIMNLSKMIKEKINKELKYLGYCKYKIEEIYE